MLSYRKDRAAGCVSVSQKWRTGTGRQYFMDSISLFNQCDIIGLLSYRIRRKKQNKGHYAVQGHSRSSRSELSQLIFQILDTLRF